jgi:hypothetical protein
MKKSENSEKKRKRLCEVLVGNEPFLLILAPKNV